MPKYIEITEDEAWAIDHTIRHTYTEGQSNVGKDLLLKVMTLVLEFEERRGKPFAPQVLPLALTEDECWAVDHQIRCDLTVNGKPIGRSILLKVFRALSEFANDRDSEAGVAHLGTLADLLRAPADENPSEELGVHDAPPSALDHDQPHRTPGEPGTTDSTNTTDPHPDDGASGPLPRGK
jgi:hypothetical protein